MTYLLNAFAYYFNPGVTENISSLKLKAKDPKDGRMRNCWYLLQSVAHTGPCVVKQGLRLAATTWHTAELMSPKHRISLVVCLPLLLPLFRLWW